jgi:copper chaperone CopZ
MMLLTPAAMLMAETGNTVVYASGNVTLNGTEVAHSATVTPGAKIETAGATATTVNQAGSKVTVSPYSAIRYGTEGVSVDRGAAAISTTDGMSAKAAQITVAPKDKDATYEIARLNNQVVITSHTGALMITEAGNTTELEAGSSSSRTAESTPAPAPAPAPQAAPVFPGYLLTGNQVFAIGAVVAGAAVTCGLWCGKAAAGVPPGGFGNQLSIVSHQGRGMNRAIQVANSAVARPILAGIANNARNGAAVRGPQQHRNIRAAH